MANSFTGLRIWIDITKLWRFIPADVIVLEKYENIESVFSEALTAGKAIEWLACPKALFTEHDFSPYWKRGEEDTRQIFPESQRDITEARK